MINYVLALAGMLLLATLFGVLIVWVARKFKVEGNPVVEQINQVLPQTQCGQCGYPGCKPYAEAIAKGEAPINQCPPGGQEGIRKLAALLDVEELELNPENGEEESVDTIVEIVEADCIGCTKCIQVCPVDAIVGAAKHMHTIIGDECTGCDLCIPACPVDCIIQIPAPLPSRIHRQEKPRLMKTIEEAQQWPS
ncbi:electron transport complex subunit RsxB [Marinicella gelatinilytica]|uniref:electron transport complex subunit RsxB n=1 Tax=Marinicella gelatinilytica TaxID=2996017 RepID=UPI00226101EF|nr:electron transport complex subunit RsxB [Marinicella gelatinilytica]MCX7544058.1 electron transport complex subunit RsxB [Marinicella gelatinilytica]